VLVVLCGPMHLRACVSEEGGDGEGTSLCACVSEEGADGEGADSEGCQGRI